MGIFGTAATFLKGGCRTKFGKFWDGGNHIYYIYREREGGG
jgi:hypothetical protein